jgi:hypothetical protein
VTSNEVTPILRKLQSREARAAGWTVEETGRGHHIVKLNGVKVALLAGTSGGGRSIQNAKAELRRAGFDFGDRQKKKSKN